MCYDGAHIIHIMVDEKFNDMAISQFEDVAPGINEYCVVSESLVLTKSSLAKCISYSELQKKLESEAFDGVVFHSLPFSHYRFLERVPAGKNVAWIGWGFDYYCLMGADDDYSRILAATRAISAPLIKRVVRSTSRAAWQKARLLWNSASLADLDRVDYFSPVLDLEYSMLQKHLRLRAEYVPWNYGTAEADLSLSGDGWAVGDNILAGNSASPLNNHIELFEIIRNQVDLTNRKVIVPLSYGDQYYRIKVMREGQRLLGNAFVPLTEFLSKERYFNVLRSCGFVMMNHLRQQALGNICVAMTMGAKVFLNSKNPIFEWLGARGGVLGQFEILDMTPLACSQKHSNRELIFSHWGRDQQRQRTEWLVRLITSKRLG